MKKHAFSLN